MKYIIRLLSTIAMTHMTAQAARTPTEAVLNLFESTDERRWDNLRSTLHDKVTLDYSSMTGQPASSLTPDEIISAWKGILPGFTHTHHQLGNIREHIDGQMATVSAYGTATHYLEPEEGSVWTLVGIYDFELVLSTDRSWEVSSMTFHFKYQDGNTALAELAMKNVK